jgi:L-arabinose transport system ATP-binding protein
MNVKENITISNLKRYSRLQFINRALEADAAEQYIRKLKIKLYSLRQKISNLSGGNQQKAVVARLLALKPKIMIMDEPTRGIDVGSKAEIHYIIEEMAESGIAVILISSELPEVLRIADRILIMQMGRIAGEFIAGQVSQEDLLRVASPSS